MSKNEILFRNQQVFFIVFEDITKIVQNEQLRTNDVYRNNLLCSISHELRTPLNGTIGYLESSMESNIINEEIKKTFIQPALINCKL